MIDAPRISSFIYCRQNWRIRNDLFSYLVDLLLHLSEHLLKVEEEIENHGCHEAYFEQLTSF